MIGQGYSNETLFKYNCWRRDFQKFADIYHPGWRLPIPVTMLACYGVWLADRGYKPTTVATRLAAVGWWSNLRGYGDPSKEFLVRRMLKGLRKGGPPKKQATPIRYGLLKRLVKSLPDFLPPYEAVMYKAVFLLAYFASLRISEYTGPARNGHCLRLKDVGFQVVEGTRGLVLVFKSYKASKRPAKLFVPQAADPVCCPVSAIEQYLRVRPRGAGPLFVRDSSRKLTPYGVTKVLRETVKRQGLPVEEYTPHAFRAGRTTDLVDMGLQDSIIREPGRWNSKAYLEYVRFDLFRLPGGAPQDSPPGNEKGAWSRS